MLRILAATGVALLALCALGGCNGESHDPADSMETWTPSGTVDSPSPSATETEAPTEPKLPEAATKATEDGARAFIRYYFDLITYAQQTGDVSALKDVSGDTCDGCQAGIVGVEEHYASGGTITGGTYTVTKSRLKELSEPAKSLYGVHAVTTTSFDEQTVIAEDGSEQVNVAGVENWDLYLIWLDQQGWRLDVMELKQ